MTKMPLQRTPEINRIVVGDKWVPITTSPTAVTTITTSTTVTGSTGTKMKSKVEDSTTKSPQKSDLRPQLTSDKLKELGFDKNEEMLKEKANEDGFDEAERDHLRFINGMVKRINLKEDALTWAPAALKLLSKLETTYGSLAVYQYCQHIDTAKKFQQKRQWWKDNFLQGTNFVVIKGQTIALEPTDLDNVATMCIKLLVKLKPKLKDIKQDAEETPKIQSSALKKIENWTMYSSK